MAGPDRKQFGTYQILGLIGSGGMATVHKALHTPSQTVVALKRLLPQFADDRVVVRQFMQEASIATCLTHPNIVKVHSYGRVGAVHFIAMELLHGDSLLSLLRLSHLAGIPAPVEVAAWVLLEMLAGLDYAMRGHTANGEPFLVVHRDVSPSNLMVTEEGRVKIIDFGVARSMCGQHATNSGRIKGKIGYMSPEVLSGKGIDGRSDVYSAAVVVWELLTARRLFRGDDKEQMRARLKNVPRIPLRHINPRVPKRLDEILSVALTRNRSDSWPSARSMQDAVLGWLDSEASIDCSAHRLVDWVSFLKTGDKARRRFPAEVKTHHKTTIHRRRPVAHNKLAKGSEEFSTKALEVYCDKETVDMEEWDAHRTTELDAGRYGYFSEDT